MTVIFFEAGSHFIGYTIYQK